MLSTIKKLISSTFGGSEENPFDQFRPEFESRFPKGKLSRGPDGKYLDPGVARDWEMLRKERTDEVMAQW